MTIPVSNQDGSSTGHAWLRRELKLAVPPPAVESYVVAGRGAPRCAAGESWNSIPGNMPRSNRSWHISDSHLRHEPIDLHDRVADTVRRDLTEELAFIAVFDRVCAAVREIVDMPDRRVAWAHRVNTWRNTPSGPARSSSLGHRVAGNGSSSVASASTSSSLRVARIASAWFSRAAWPASTFT